MADNVILNAPTTSGATIATDEIDGVQHQLVKVEFGVDGAATMVSAAAPLPVIAALPVGAATSANQQTDALTDTELRASPVPVSGTFFQATQPVSATSLPLPAGAATAALQQNNALTDTELRATPVPISGTVSTGLSQPLTDTQLRASAVPVSAASLPLPAGAATAALQQTDALTDTQLRATAVPVSAASLPLPSGAATAANQTTGNTSLATIAGAVSGTEMQVDILTLPALPAGTNNIGDVDILSVIPGTGTTSLGKAEDAGHTTGDTGVMVLGVSNEGGTALVNANLDYTPQAVDKMGQLYINPENIKVLFRGRSSTFRTPGRAGTSGQKILTVHNATGSSITVRVKKIVVDMWCTVVKAVTVAPPIIRIWKFTAVPTNGTALTKNKIGGTTTSNASCVVTGDASADGTGSATTLTVTLPAGTILDQLVCRRVITAVGEINTNPMMFEYLLTGINLAALEGICVFLDYTLATQNPTTDMWVASVEFEESTT